MTDPDNAAGRASTGEPRPLGPAEADTWAAARLRALHEMPYLASALFRVTPLAVPGQGIIGVDSNWRLYVDPDLLATWSPAAAAGALLHEVCHLIRDHHARRVGRRVSDVLLWNIAADAEINDDLLAAGIELPLQPVTPELLGASDGLLAEEYLDHLHASLTPRVAVACGSGAGGEPLSCEVEEENPDSPTELEQQLIRHQIASAIRAAADHGTGRSGNAPAGMRRWADQVLGPSHVPWERQLRAGLRRGLAERAGQLDFRYHRPGRRQIPDIVTPAMVQPVPSVVTVLDTSASMSDAHLSTALREIDAICRRAGLPDGGHRVMTADARPYGVDRIRSAREVRMSGGGGTDLRPAIHAALAVRPKPDVLVVCTDGRTPWPQHRPPGLTAVIVVLITDGSDTPTVPAWARAIRVPVTG